RHGGEGGRLEPDYVHLRGGARPDPRAEPPLVPRLPAPVARGVLQTEHDAPWHLLDRLDRGPGSEVEEELSGLDGRGPRVRPEGWHHHNGRRRGGLARILVRAG